MPVKRLHTDSPLFFPDPYMVRVEYGHDHTEASALTEYRKLTRQTYKNIQGTWGYSQLSSDVVRVKGKEPSPVITPAHNGGLVVSIASLFDDSDHQIRYRGYFCFKDEVDALQFRLSLSTISLQVHMWPKNTRFTIHEVVEDES